MLKSSVSEYLVSKKNPGAWTESPASTLWHLMFVLKVSCSNLRQMSVLVVVLPTKLEMLDSQSSGLCIKPALLESV